MCGGSLPSWTAALGFDIGSIFFFVNVLSLNATSLLQGPTKVDPCASDGETFISDLFEPLSLLTFHLLIHYPLNIIS